MAFAADIATVAPGLFTWQAYDGSVKADLCSSAVATTAGLVLIDPIQLAPAPLAELTCHGSITGIVVTNENHERAAAEFVATSHAPVFMHEILQDRIGLPNLVRVPDNSAISAGLTAVHVDGAPAGEIALIYTENGGTLVVGDALINFEPYRFTFLPAKYCTDSKVMRRSLAKLLDYRFERILFAHGTPIIRDGRGRLEQLLSGKS